MLTTALFDTHKAIKKLISAGLPVEQAEAIVEAFKDAQNTAQLAENIGLTEAKIDILKWAFGMMFVQTALILTVLPKLIH